MEGTWPLRLDGVICGTVSARSSGAYTVFTASAAYEGDVKRISLYGGGAEGYLGVLAPDSEGVALTRRLTRSQLKGFPAEPEFAAEAGLNPDSGPKQPPEPEKRTEREQDKGEPETAPPEGGALWYSAPDGTLSRFDGRRMLVALPSENVRVPDWAKGVVQRINGREYVVFPR